MSKQVKLRRGSTAQHATFTGAVGEVTVDTDKKVTVVHDGSTAGGIPSAREDRGRGWTKTVYFTTVGASTYSTTGKTDLKRLRVTCYGGGGGGSTASYGSGGGSGAMVVRVLDISEITTTVTVTVGGGGAAGATGVTGGTTSFGAYISATGGTGGAQYSGGQGGTGSGTNTLTIGGQGGTGGNNFYAPPFYSSYYATVWPAVTTVTNGAGGGIGGGGAGQAGQGISGSGGGYNAAGGQGCVIVEEIYGLA
jgi:hypothetical protein